MTKPKTCRYTSSRLFNRIAIWLGFSVELHNWKPYRRQNKNLTYHCRRCECGADEVQNAGPLGDDEWQDVSAPFRWDWEKVSFDESKEVP